ncbi:MAG: epoxide hydrolase family protein [Thermomicrobiales bacterium]
MTTPTTATTSTSITPFTIAVPQETLDDLHARLEHARFAETIPGTGWTLGTDAEALQQMVAHWRDAYDWRAWEARLNAYPHFTTEIDGQRIHFLHIRSGVAGATPLLLVHGWPGSLLEFLEVIDPLVDPVAHGGSEDDAFHLVIPSLPGMTFSGPTRELGWNATRMAEAFAELMARLGYARYGVQGGDFGAFVAPEMGRFDREHVIVTHVNAATAGFIPWGEVSEEEKATLTPLEQERLDRLATWNRDGRGYFAIMSTKPQTISFGLADSPVGQLSWFLEKFHDWTNGHNEAPAGAIDPDLALTDVMLYWVTNTAATASQMYWESMHSAMWSQEKSPTPMGVAVFAEDVAIRRYGEDAYTIVHWSDFDRGGHFAAMEVPDLLVGDIRAFFAGLRH